MKLRCSQLSCEGRKKLTLKLWANKPKRNTSGNLLKADQKLYEGFKGRSQNNRLTVLKNKKILKAV